MADFSYYIGVDHREPDATRVAAHSAAAFSKTPLHIGYLDHLALRRRQLFDRPWRIGEDGLYTDERDGKPFTTQFAHTRFLAPLVAKQDGHTGWCLFTDADWLWLEDPHKILREADPTKTVMVVPHKYQPTVTIKMDGQPQSRYNRKLWSALALWNLNSKYLPTPEMVNMADGGYLHRFEWLPDSEIGFLSEAWHWLPGISPTTDAAKLLLKENNKHVPINAIHFTLGVPDPAMTDREPTAFDQLWHNELVDAYRNAY